MDNIIQELKQCGYDEETIMSLMSYTKEDVDLISDEILLKDAEGCTSVDNPTAVYIGGQPGAGKSVISMGIKKADHNFVEISMDNYRTYHPNYQKIEECIKEHWADRKMIENDTPGNDIAHFTHNFSGEVVDEVIRKATDRKYNVAIEWNLREPYQPLNSMKELKDKGYKVNVWSLAVSKYISSDAYKMRADIMNKYGHIMRRVSKKFHDRCIIDLPDSLDYLKIHGVDTGIIDQLCVIDRNGKILWDKSQKSFPGNILDNIINSKVNDAEKHNNPTFAKLSFAKEGEGLSLELAQNKSVTL